MNRIRRPAAWLPVPPERVCVPLRKLVSRLWSVGARVFGGGGKDRNGLRSSKAYNSRGVLVCDEASKDRCLVLSTGLGNRQTIVETTVVASGTENTCFCYRLR